jgi:hypothetical protein
MWNRLNKELCSSDLSTFVFIVTLYIIKIQEECVYSINTACLQQFINYASNNPFKERRFLILWMSVFSDNQSYIY